MRVFFGIDATKGFPRWWRGDPYLISAAVLWNKKRYRFRIFRKRPLQGLFFLDSGGFSFFSKEGVYPFSPDEYLEFIRKVRPDFFATMDYPCEPDVNRSALRTNKDRIEATVDYGVYLWKRRHTVDSKPIVVIQGYTLEEYTYCYELYRKRGVDADYWAFGSMCRRWKDSEIRKYVRYFREKLIGNGPKIHIFGIKISAINRDVVESVDSIDTAAWCYAKYTGGWGCTEENFLRYKEKLKTLIERAKTERRQLSFLV